MRTNNFILCIQTYFIHTLLTTIKGYKGVLKHANLAKNNLDLTHTTPGGTTLGNASLI